MSNNEHIPRFSLERLVAKDLTPAEGSSISIHLGACTECRKALEELHLDTAAFKAEVPYAAFRIEHEHKQTAHIANATPIWRRFWVPAFSAAAALAVILLTGVTPRRVEDDHVRIKGAGVSLTFAVLERGIARQGENGETLPAGTTLQLSYDAGDFTYVAVVGTDASGSGTVYYPENGSTLAPLPSGVRGTLPFSLTLDPTPGREHFVAVFSREPLPLVSIVAALHKAGENGELILPVGVAQSTVWMEKR